MKAPVLLLCLLLAPAVEAKTIVRSTMGGDLDVASAPEGATLRTMGGDIHVKSSNGQVVAKTMGGGIRIDNAAGSVRASTMGGEVEVEIVGNGVKRNVEIQSMGGTVEVTLPADFSAVFEVELERDDDDEDVRIESDFPLQITQSHRTHWFQGVTVFTASGRNGAGANRVKITTTGGGIRIRRR